jgi:P4 family phage/plasmid primase-like protien
MGAITILESAGPRLAKKITPSGIEPYDDAAYFTPSVVEISDIIDLQCQLSAIAENRRVCVVRGTPIGAAAAAAVVFEDGKDPVRNGRYLRRAEMFRDEPSSWLMLDVDGGDDQGMVDTALIRWVSEHLPAEFHNTTFVYQLSSSHGVKPGLRAHLWFWLETPMTSMDMREWGKAWNHTHGKVIDTAVFSPVQIHYTAAPEVDDPFGMFDLPRKRIDIVFGNKPAVALQAVIARVEPAIPGSDDDVDWSALERRPRMEDIDAEQAQKYLDLIPNTGEHEADYDRWLEVGMALHHQFGEDGLDIWRAWSSVSSKYDARDLERRWKSFRSKRAGTVTFATIIHLAGGKLVDTDSEDALCAALTDKINLCDSPSKLTGQVLKEVALARVNETLRIGLIESVKRAARVNLNMTLTLAQLKRDVRSFQRAESDEVDKLASNLELVLSDEALIEHFGKGAHLMVFGGNVWHYRDGRWGRVSDKGVIASYVLTTVTRLMGRGDQISKAMAAQLIDSSDRADRIGALVEAVTKVLLMKVTTSEEDPLGLADFTPKSAITGGDGKATPRSVMNVKNGELWFDIADGSTTFLPHDPDSRLYQQIATNYDENARCPRWDGMIKRVFAHANDDDDQIRHFYELLGYTVQENRSFGEAWVLWQSEGGTGKSTVMSIIGALIGQSSTVQCSLSALDKRGAGAHFEAGLVGKLLLIDDDFKAKECVPDDWVKKLTGAKMLTANPKFGGNFNFLCRTMVFILTNHWPSTRDISEGIRRRTNVFSGGSKIAEDDVEPGLMLDIIQTELPGILNHLIAGWVRLIKRGRLKMPAGCEEAKQKWLMSGSTVMRFVGEAMDVTKNPDDREKANDVYELYQDFCTQQEGLGHSMSRQKFYESLEDIGLRIQVGGARVKFLLGCQIKDEFRGRFEDFAAEFG